MTTTSMTGLKELATSLKLELDTEKQNNLIASKEGLNRELKYITLPIRKGIRF